MRHNDMKPLCLKGVHAAPARVGTEEAGMGIWRNSSALLRVVISADRRNKIRCHPMYQSPKERRDLPEGSSKPLTSYPRAIMWKVRSYREARWCVLDFPCANLCLQLPECQKLFRLHCGCRNDYLTLFIYSSFSLFLKSPQSLLLASVR